MTKRRLSCRLTAPPEHLHRASFPRGGFVVEDLSSTERFLLSSLENPIAVVGNGALRELGATIDSFSSVIRINQFQTESFEEHSGEKATHWCVRFHVELPPEHAHLVPFTPYARTDTLNWCHRQDILFACEPMSERIRRWAPRILPRRFGFVLRKKHLETTGFALTVLLLDLGFKPTLFGFDGLQTGHYFDPGHKHWRGHVKRLQEMDYLLDWGVLHQD